MSGFNEFAVNWRSVGNRVPAVEAEIDRSDDELEKSRRMIESGERFTIFEKEVEVTDISFGGR